MKTTSLANPVSTKLPNLLGGMPAFRIGRTVLVLAAVLVVSRTPVFYAQSPNTVSLVPDTCPVIRDGDIVTFTFTPQFDVPSAVRGLRNIELKFSHEGRPDPANAPEAEFTLHVVPQRGEHEAPGAPMVVGSDGSLQLRFRANLRSTARGAILFGRYHRGSLTPARLRRRDPKDRQHASS